VRFWFVTAVGTTSWASVEVATRAVTTTPSKNEIAVGFILGQPPSTGLLEIGVQQTDIQLNPGQYNIHLFLAPKITCDAKRQENALHGSVIAEVRVDGNAFCIAPADRSKLNVLTGNIEVASMNT